MIKALPTTCILLTFLVSCVPGGGNYRDGWRNGWFYNKDDRAKIVRTAKRYLGVKYKNGGTSPRGFDCSGYVMYVYEKNGILLPRSVKSQYNAGKKIGPRQRKPGDLVFFKPRKESAIRMWGYTWGIIGLSTRRVPENGFRSRSLTILTGESAISGRQRLWERGGCRTPEKQK